MKTKTRIVTDSTALFTNPTLVQQYGIDIVPVYVWFGSERFQLGLEIDPEEFLHRLRYGQNPPRLEAPSVDELHAVYTRLNRQVNQIVSLHVSTHLSDVYRNAVTASQRLLGRCDIAVIDSLTMSAGLGVLVEKTAQLTLQTNDLEEIVREVRRTIAHIYTVFYVQNMDTICQHGLLSEAQTFLGSMLGIMPFVTMEEGQLIIMEKALNNAQAIDKLVEFASEFTDIEQLIILHDSATLTDTVRQLQDRLAVELGISNFPTQLYDGIVATYLGPEATGIVVLESEEEDEDFL